MKRVITITFMVCLMAMTITCGTVGCTVQKEQGKQPQKLFVEDALLDA